MFKTIEFDVIILLIYITMLCIMYVYLLHSAIDKYVFFGKSNPPFKNRMTFPVWKIFITTKEFYKIHII